MVIICKQLAKQLRLNERWNFIAFSCHGHDSWMRCCSWAYYNNRGNVIFAVYVCYGLVVVFQHHWCFHHICNSHWCRMCELGYHENIKHIDSPSPSTRHYILICSRIFYFFDQIKDYLFTMLLSLLFILEIHFLRDKLIRSWNMPINALQRAFLRANWRTYS